MFDRVLNTPHMSSASGNKCIICHMTLQDHPIEVPYKFICESSSGYVNTLISLMTVIVLILVKKKNA